MSRGKSAPRAAGRRCRAERVAPALAASNGREKMYEGLGAPRGLTELLRRDGCGAVVNGCPLARAACGMAYPVDGLAARLLGSARTVRGEFSAAARARLAPAQPPLSLPDGRCFARSARDDFPPARWR